MSRVAQTPIDRRALILAGGCEGLAAWTKTEGLLHLLSLVAAVALVSNTKRSLAERAKDVGFTLLGALPSLAIIAAYKVMLNVPNDFFTTERPAGLWAQATDWSRYWLVFRWFIRLARSREEWGLTLVIGTAAFVVLNVVRRPRAEARLVAVALLLTGLGFTFAYAISPYDLPWHVARSMDRLVLQSLPGLMLGLGLALPSSWLGSADTAANQAQQTPNRTVHVRQK